MKGKGRWGPWSRWEWVGSAWSRDRRSIERTIRCPECGQRTAVLGENQNQTLWWPYRSKGKAPLRPRTQADRDWFMRHRNAWGAVRNTRGSAFLDRPKSRGANKGGTR